jgi:hypothetical protein
MKTLAIQKLTMALAFAAMAITPTFAQSSKATAAITTAVGCTSSGATTIGDTLPVNCHDIFSGASIPVTADYFVPVMTTSMSVSASQSIFATASLVSGLYTETKTKNNTNSTSTATAMGGVYMRAVLTDPNTGAVVMVADPISACTNEILGCAQDSTGVYGVVLDARIQTLTQTLSNCVVTITGGGTGSCDFTSTLDLILNTTSAHTFAFIFPNVGVGTYNIVIEAAVNTNATVGGSGTAIAGAAYGLGSLTAESVRLVHGFSF